LIGVVLAMPTLARLTAVPLVARSAERRGAIAQTILGTAILTAAGFALLALMPTPFAIAMMLLVTACVWTPIVPLTDAYALRGVALLGVDYGPIRLWGSAAYIAGVLAAGFVAVRVAADHLIWVIVAIAALSALAALRIEPLPPATGEEKQRGSARGPLREPAVIAILAAAALIQGSHAVYYSFSSIAWQAEGFSSATIASLWSVCVAAEIILFALSPRLDLGFPTLIIIGGIGAAVRWGITALEPSIAVLSIAQAMHALSFAATHLGTMGLLARMVPGHSIATAQGALTAAIGLVTASASAVCGLLFNAYGQSLYFGMAAMAAVGAVLMLSARHRVEQAVA
jgi:PPP family 3-phenylpropionic acid transporter